MEILSANHGQTLQNPPIISLLEKRKDHVHEHHNVPLTLAARFSRGRWLNLAKRHRERADIPCNFKPAVFIHVRAAVHTRSPPELDLPSLRSKFTFQQIENRRATKSPPQCLNCRSTKSAVDSEFTLVLTISDAGNPVPPDRCRGSAGAVTVWQSTELKGVEVGVAEFHPQAHRLSGEG